MGLKKRSQVAIEYVLIFGFVLLITTSVLGAIGHRMVITQKQNNELTRDKVNSYLKSHIGFARSADDGFESIFRLPAHLEGMDYSINISDNNVLVVNFANGRNYLALSDDVMGKFCYGPWDEPKYQVRIQKINGTVEISSCDNCTVPYQVCNEANKTGTCGSLSSDVLEQCRKGYCKCLP